jgi:hypothetical protein
MKYIYINSKENRVVSINKKPIPEVKGELDEYIVTDAFDLTKAMPSEDGADEVYLEGFLTAEEFLERFNTNYIAQRVNNYPPIEEQLDMIYHAGLGGEVFQSTIQAVKAAYPKPEEVE